MEIFMHICVVCFRPASHHSEVCDQGHRHWPLPLCCAGAATSGLNDLDR